VTAAIISILDGQGNLIESGDMFPFQEDPTLGGFFPEVLVTYGSEVIVRILPRTACMGSIAVSQLRKTAESVMAA
jgi:hypothetical protein